jgi:hypothetical protein
MDPALIFTMADVFLIGMQYITPQYFRSHLSGIGVNKNVNKQIRKNNAGNARHYPVQNLYYYGRQKIYR